MKKARTFGTVSHWGSNEGVAPVSDKKEKFCNRCKTIHPIEVFSEDLETSDGYRNRCNIKKVRALSARNQ